MRFARLHAPLYYGQDAKDPSSNFPSVENVAKVYKNLGEATSDEFLWFNGFFIEPCARSLLYRNAYNDDDVDVIVTSHPDAARAVFKQVRAINPVNQDLSVATFLGPVDEVEANVNGHINEENTVPDDGPAAEPSEVPLPDVAAPDGQAPEPKPEQAESEEPAAEPAVESVPEPVSEQTAQTTPYGAPSGVPANDHPTPDQTTSEPSKMYRKNGKLKKRKGSAQVAVADVASW